MSTDTSNEVPEEINREDLISLIAEKNATAPEFPQWPESVRGTVRLKLDNFALNDISPSTQQCTNKSVLCLEEDTSGLTVQFIGTGGMVLDDGETVILIDPYFSRVEFKSVPDTFNDEDPSEDLISPSRERVEEGLRFAGVTRADAIFCSHGHFDHVLDIGYVQQVLEEWTGIKVPIYGGPSVLNAVLGQLLDEPTIESFKNNYPEPNDALQEELRTHYINHELKEIQCPYNVPTDDIGDNAEDTKYQIFNVNGVSEINLNNFKMKFFRGRHIKIPTTGGVNGPVYYPYKMNNKEIWRCKEGELISLYLEHTDPQTNKCIPIIAMGSTNFLAGQMDYMLRNEGFKENSTLLIGAAGITFALGAMAGPYGLGDGWGRDDLYREIIFQGKVKRILFNHWDNFAEEFSPDKKVKWLKTKFLDYAIGCVDDFYDVADSETDPLYRMINESWNNFSDEEKRDPQNQNMNPENTRSFRFLPLFKRIKL